MDTKQWTPEQEAAISSRGEILVAAAAGSGKTAVLVERLLRQIVDPEHPVDIERFLVVTFTKAAAQEMRERVRKTLEENLLSAQDESAELLLRQLNRLPLANIATLHSFCLDLIRRYFYLLALDPAFRVADEGEIGLMRQDVLEEVLEENYLREDEGFVQLVEAFGSDRDDLSLMAELLRLYDFANSQINPEEWLNNLPAGYYWQDGEELWESPWGKAVRQGVADRLQTGIAYLEGAERLANRTGGPDHYLGRLQEDRAGLLTLIKLVQEGNWQALQLGLSNFNFERLPSRRKAVGTETGISEQVKGLRDEVKKIISGLKTEFGWGLEAQLEGLHSMGELVARLVKLVQNFAQAFARAKRDRNVVDFADLEHMAHKLLQVQEWGIAVSLREEFVEVLVDEYQDINAVQEAILRQVSRSDGNLFMVGDVKQSIYRFRMADPGLFLAKYKAFPHFPETGLSSNMKGQVIDLARNFRSRSQIVDGINFVFGQIMTEGAGEIAYDDLAALKYGATYAHSQSGFAVSDGPIEVHFVDGRKRDETDEENTGTQASTEVGAQATENPGSEAGSEKEDRFELETEKAEEREGIRREAYMLAQRLRAIVAEGEFQVLDSRLKAYRPVRYSDIVILLRSFSTNAAVFQEELERANIPVFAETGSGYFAANEVETVLSLLKVIDNPHQDIPLAAVLRSPLAGFSGAELGKLRALQSQGDFYEALAAVTTPGLALDLPRELQDKATIFWSKLERWRGYAQSHPLSELLVHIFEETLYLAYCGMLPNGAQRQANLQALYERARRFEETHYRGLFRFLRFLERFQDQGKDLGQARVLGEKEDVVRIMTVHASKGLEFPVVFVAGLGKKFNLKGLGEKTLLHPRLGIGIPILDIENKVRYPSLIQQALRQKLLEEALAEELRILYVGLTRAKEKLLLYGSVPDLPRAIEGWQQAAGRAGGVFSDAELRAARSFLDWIGPALASHPDKPLESEVHVLATQPPGSRWQVICHQEETLVQAREVIDREDECGLKPMEQDADVSAWNDSEVDGKDSDENDSKGNERIEKDGAERLRASVVERLGWTYPFSDVTTRLAKTSVSELKRQQKIEPDKEHGFSEYSFSRPKFLEVQLLTPAEKGTALHLVMQHLPLEEWRAAGGWGQGSAEIEGRLLDYIQALEDREILTPQQCQALSLASISEFLQSPLGQRMLSASKVWREVPFTLALTAEAGEVPQLVQGVIDALIFSSEGDGVELVDYKTDHLPSMGAEEVLRARYGLQLGYYTWAVESLLQVKVEQATLYAFSLGREIPCDPVWLAEVVSLDSLGR